MWQGKQFLEFFLRFSSKPLLICFSFMNEMIWILFVFTGNYGNSVRSFLSCSLRYPANNVSSVTTSLFCDFSYKFHDSSRRSQLVTPVFHLLVCTFTESLASRIEVRCLLLSWLLLSFRFFLWWFGWQLWFFSSAVHNFFHHRHTGSTSDCSLHLVLIDAYRRESLWVVVSVSHCSAVCCLSVLSVESSFIFRLLFPRRPAENISGDCRRLRWF